MTQLRLLFGARHEHDILYRDELDALMKKHPHFRVEPTLSRSEGHWSGKRGYVQAHARALYEELSQATETPPHVYICGLERMVGTVRALLRKEMGLPPPARSQRAIRLSAKAAFGNRGSMGKELL